MNKYIKIILAIIGFGFFSSAFLAFDANSKNKNNEVFIYIALAILFQPLIKIALGRIIWNIVDIVVGIGLLLSLYKTENK